MLKMFAGNFIGNITRFKHNVMNSWWICFVFRQ
jgi:hypothetical protein